MDRKQLLSRMAFGLIFIGVAAVGGSFIAKGVTGILGQNEADVSNGSNNPLNPTSPNTSSNQSNKPSLAHKGNICVRTNTQPLTWGRVAHFDNKPDEYPSSIQYRQLVKIINFTSKSEQGVIFDYYNPKEPNKYLDRDTVSSILQHINVKGYVHFNEAQSDSSGTNGGTSVHFSFGNDYTLFNLLNNNDYITLSAKNSYGNPVPPSYISLEFTYSTSSWFYNGTQYSFDLASADQNTFTYVFDLNIIGMKR